MGKNGWNSNINMSMRAYEHFLSNYYFKMFKNKYLTLKSLRFLIIHEIKKEGLKF